MNREHEDINRNGTEDLLTNDPQRIGLLTVRVASRTTCPSFSFSELDFAGIVGLRACRWMDGWIHPSDGSGYDSHGGVASLLVVG